jgi:hypothetical protein
MDEGLLHFGMMENAITIDSWSLWNVEDAATLHVYVFCFCDVLLFTCEKCCFSFFMVAMAFNVYQISIFWLFGACGLWSACAPIFEGNFYWKKVKFSCLSSVRSASNFFFFCFWMLIMCVVYISWLAMTFNKKECEGNAFIEGCVLPLHHSFLSQ